jgi:hypothetical protein
LHRYASAESKEEVVFDVTAALSNFTSGDGLFGCDRLERNLSSSLQAIFSLFSILLGR